MSNTDEQAAGATQHAERRHDDEWRRQVNQRLNDGAQKMDGLSASLEENTKATKAIEKSTADLVTFFESVKGAFRVLEMIGKAAKPVGIIAVAVTSLIGLFQAGAALYALLIGGGPPK